MNSRSLLTFLGLNKSKNEVKFVHSVGPDPARGYSPWSVPAYHAQWPDSYVGLSLAARSNEESSPWPAAWRARRARSRHGRRVRDGVVALSSVARWWLAGGKMLSVSLWGHREDTRHGGRGWSSLERQRNVEAVEKLRATTFNGGETAPVMEGVDGMVLQYWGGR
jgi:hypothetical protein